MIWIKIKLKFKSDWKLSVLNLQINPFVYKLFLFTYIKMSKHSSDKYQDNKERLQRNSLWKISVFLKKKKKQQYGHEQYKNLPENEKQKLVQLRKIIT